MYKGLTQSPLIQNQTQDISAEDYYARLMKDSLYAHWMQSDQDDEGIKIWGVIDKKKI